MKNHVMKTNRAFKEFCVLGGLAYSVCGVARTSEYNCLSGR